MIEVKTAGKLYVAGEYQVLKTGGNAILYSIQRYMTFRIAASDDFYYITRSEKVPFSVNNDNVIFKGNNKLVNETIKVVFEYLKYKGIKLKPFRLLIISDLETKNYLKYGFGSSAAVITGIIKALLSFYNFDYDNQLIFKLAVISQIKADELSSGGDLAASLNQGYIYYERYDLNFVLANMSNNDIVEKEWPNLLIEKLDVKNIKLIAAWTKKIYKTKPLDKELDALELKEAYGIVLKLRKALEESDYVEVVSTISSYNNWMKNILANSNRYIDKYDLLNEITSNYHLVSKPSGAGGGDSAIILYQKDEEINQIKTAVEAINYNLIYV